MVISEILNAENDKTMAKYVSSLKMFWIIYILIMKGKYKNTIQGDVQTFMSGARHKLGKTFYQQKKLKNWMLILVLFCENERQRWDASRYT